MRLLLLLVVVSFLHDVTACGGQFTSPTGTLQSPGFPASYPNNQDCVYVIRRPEGERITLNFTDFDTRGGAGCSEDYVEIRDGESENSPQIVRACNSSLPSPKRSFRNYMWIRFRSDATNTSTGFRASYTSGVMGDEFFLITSSNGRIFRMDVETSSNIVIPGLRLINPIAVDFDPVEERVYWTDVVFRHVASAFLNGSDSRVLLDLDAESVPDGLAVDPLSRLVFYTDSGNDVIAVVTMSGSFHKTVINTSLAEPRAIALDTINGVMFWTDWGVPDKIERANYDGSDRRTLHSFFLFLPNALALDLDNNRLYWVDAHTDLVEYSDLDGNSRSILYDLSSSDKYHFFGLTYHDNQLYVTDWTSAGSSTTRSHIHRLSTDGNGGKTIGSLGARMNDIHIYSETHWEKGPNGCGSNNGGCAYFCIPSSGNTSRCMCPDLPTDCAQETTTPTTTTSLYTTSTTQRLTVPETTTLTTTTTLYTTSTIPAITVTIAGPRPFATDSSKEMTLTCDPDSNEAVTRVTWNVTCERQEGRNCVWKPTPPGDDGKVVTCSIVYASGQSGVGHFQAQLHYPPSGPPEIHGYEPGHVLQAGESLRMTCVVSDGTPLVTSVIFFCDGHSDDDKDIRVGSQVQSHLVINPLSASDDGSRCTCTAEWGGTDWYTLSATRRLIVTDPGSASREGGKDSAPPVGVIAGAAGGGVAVIIIIVIIIIIIRRRRDRTYDRPAKPASSRAPEVSPYSSLGSRADLLPVPDVHFPADAHSGGTFPAQELGLECGNPTYEDTSGSDDYAELAELGDLAQGSFDGYLHAANSADGYLHGMDPTNGYLQGRNPSDGYLHATKPAEGYLHAAEPTDGYLHPTEPTDGYLRAVDARQRGGVGVKAEREDADRWNVQFY